MAFWEAAATTPALCPSIITLMPRCSAVPHDVIAGKLKVFKVETIGDVYMVVSGLPKKLAEDRHAIEIAEMALDLLHSLKNAQLSHKLENQIQLRAGIHSGKIT